MRQWVFDVPCVSTSHNWNHKSSCFTKLVGDKDPSTGRWIEELGLLWGLLYADSQWGMMNTIPPVPLSMLICPSMSK